MYQIRTDLALETQEKMQEDHVELKGVRFLEEKLSPNLTVSTVVIETENGAKTMGKPKGTYITIEAADANRKFVYLSVDGGKAFSLKNGDKVRVRQSRFTTKLVRLSKKSFCEILDSKMGMEVATHEE